jgi:hypothetical protein
MKTAIEESEVQKEEAKKILETVDNIVDSVITG